MNKIENDNDLLDWLNGKEIDFAVVLAARAALRVVPVLELVLNGDDEQNRNDIILPSFRALVAVSFVGAWPRRAAEARDVARIAGKQASNTVRELYNSAQMAAIETKEIEPDLHHEIWQLEQYCGNVGIAARALDAIEEATESVVAMVDARASIGSSAAVYDAAVSVARHVHSAVDGIHGDTELSFELEEDEATHQRGPHFVEVWKAMEHDVKWMEENATAQIQSPELIAELHEQALWLAGTPVWVSRRWTELKDKLPESEGWDVWTRWYESRLAGSKLDATLLSHILNASNDDWDLGPAHVNSIIGSIFESRSDPVFTALAHGFENLDSVKQISSIDLKQYSDRINSAIPSDPHQAIGATKELLEATMKTILDRRGLTETSKLNFPDLTTKCLLELGLIGTTKPKSVSETHTAKIASDARRMIVAANNFRVDAGTGHGRVAGKEPKVSPEDAGLVASIGLILSAWLLHHDAKD